MACTTEKTSSFPVQVESKPTVTERFYVEVERCGTAGQYSFKTVVKRKSDDEIIARTTSTGFILFENLKDNEKPKQDIIKRQVRQALNKAKNFAIGNNLTHLERTVFLNQLGFKNTANEEAINQENDTTEGTIFDPKITGKNEDPLPKPMTFEDINLNIQGRRFRKKYEDLSYPEGLGSNRQDRIRFEQIYNEGKIIAGTGVSLQGKVFQRNQKRIKGSVTLPIVTGIGDKNEVDWQGATLNPLQALGASGALSLFRNAETAESIGEAFSRGGTAINEAAKEIRGTVGRDMQTAINIYLAQKAVGAQGLLSRATGAVLNPNLEMLFSGPSLRNFDFTFKLSPRDGNEAEQVRKIIRFFKQGMSVKTSSSNVFLKAPNIFKIQYQTFNTDGDEILHPSLNIIKECALKSCDVQYTPDGTYMTYDDPFRTMTSYQLTLSFGELDPIYDSDYTELDNDQDQVIGY